MEENLSPLFHALADPNRLRIIELLRQEALTVGAIAERLDISQPQTSKQLRVLYDAGLVSVTIEANRRRYALNRQALAPMEIWRSRLEAETARLDGLEEFLQQSKREGKS